MQQTVTAKLQIKVNPEDFELLHRTMRAYAEACRYVSDYIFRTNSPLVHRAVHDDKYYEIRELFGLRSQMAESCIRTVIASYRAIQTSQHRRIQPVFRRPQLDLVWNRDYSLGRDGKTFSVNTLDGRIRVAVCRRGFERCFREGCRFGTAKLVFRHGKFFLHVPVTYEVEELQMSEVTNVVGIDRGVRFLATAYDSSGRTTFYDGSAVKQKRAHYKKLRQELQQVKTPSSRRRLKAIGSRENRWISDTDHCIAKALVESSPAGTMFVLEDLTGIRGVTERVRVDDRYLMVSWPYYDLEQKLRYKAERNRQMVIKVDPRYTSQTCPKCGHTHKLNRDKKKHEFECRACGYRSNDDRVAAMNLYSMGMRRAANG